jgi:hypothetical protein
VVNNAQEELCYRGYMYIQSWKHIRSIQQEIVSDQISPLMPARIKSEACKQGDQIGRIFAFWAVVILGSFLKITEVAQIFGYFLYDTYKLCIRFDKKWVGLHFGRFFY